MDQQQLKTTINSEVTYLHRKHYTYRMQWRGVRNLNFMDQIQIHIIYITKVGT
jgi:hypothetical protein